MDRGPGLGKELRVFMSELSPIGPGRLARVDAPGAPRLAPRGAHPDHPERAPDEVQVSPQAHFLNRLRENPIREELVADVREQIAQGTYETPEKIEGAISELSQDL
jgi:negative regulator of flagellin synthesis FlgM